MKNTMIIGLIFSFIFAGVLNGCASKQELLNEELSVPENYNLNKEERNKAGEIIQKFDINNDSKPDIFKYLNPTPDGGKRLVRKEVDINQDGKIDIIRKYDSAGRASEEKIDSDFDQIYDITIFFAGGNKIRQEYDTNYDGKTDVWKFFDGDHISRVELDKDNNGKPEQYEYYNADGKIDRIELDHNNDGRIDKVYVNSDTFPMEPTEKPEEKKKAKPDKKAADSEDSDDADGKEKK